MTKTVNVLRPASRSHGGVRLNHHKNTAEQPTVTMPSPAKVIIPLSQHIGAHCEPVVGKGDSVKVGQLIADAGSVVSAPIHASVSGVVTGIRDVVTSSGNKCLAIEIESDGKMEVVEGLKPPVVNNRDELVAAVRQSGLVGLGGAGFPSSVKLNPSKDKSLDTLIINGAECEPYITADYRECVESARDIMDGVYILQKLLGINNVIICVEENKPRAIEILSGIAAIDDDIGDNVRIMKLKSLYPQGAEKILIRSATGRVVPAGKLPIDVGCIVMNITSLSFISKYLKTGMPLVSKRITVDGGGVKNPQNVIVPVGTMIKDVIDFCGGYNGEPKKIICGGPMMGAAVADVSIPVSKANNAILVLNGKEGMMPKSTACIRCGRCVAACPMKLMPLEVERALKGDNADRLNDLSVMSCMECGCCSFSCPAKRPLVQSMRLAKKKVRGR